MSDRPPLDIETIASRAMIARGFMIDYPADVIAETKAAKDPTFKDNSIRDLTKLLWTSIDNDESEDLDQIEYSEIIPGGIRVYVAIADVSSLVKKDSAVDRFAKKNTTSVYTGVTVFPMLPPRFSTDLSSLNESCTRLAIVTEMDFLDSGEKIRSTVYRAAVINKSQLTYEGVSAWLNQTRNSQSAKTQEVLAKIDSNPEIQNQLIMQDRLCSALIAKRQREGALEFQSTQLRPTILPDGKVELTTQIQNRASHIIEEFMIASNESGDAFLESKGLPTVQRVVRTPKNWPRMVTLAEEHGGKLPAEPDGKSLQQFLAEQLQSDPDHFSDLSLAMIKLLGRGEYVVKAAGDKGIGHFGLAALNYSHTTAPNRRYPDLIMQRLLESAFNNTPPPYTMIELDQLAKHCTAKEDDANRVERQVTKSLAAISLTSRIGEDFNGIITGASVKGVFVRITDLPIEGKIYGNNRNLEVGMNVRVKLIQTDPFNGFIDFRIADDAR